MPVIEDRVASDRIQALERRVAKLTDKVMRQPALFDSELIRANPLPDPPPEPTLARWGIKAGVTDAGDELWLWAKRSTNLWAWNGPFHVMS